MDHIITNWTNLRPENDVGRFTERSVERRQLFEAIRAAGNDAPLAPVAWAFLQVADLERIRYLANPGAIRPLVVLRNQLSHVIHFWRQKTEETAVTAGNASPAHRSRNVMSGQSSSTSPRPGVTPDSTSRIRSKRKHDQPEYSIGRSPTVAQSCKRRDGNLCAVSRMKEIDAAHIYPWCAFGHVAPQRVVQFWEALEVFWSRELVQSWRDKILVVPNEPNRGTEMVANMISLTATLHRFQFAGAFALRPIQMSDDKTQLELEFHWLAREERDSNSKVDLMAEPLSSRDWLFSGNGYGPFIRIVDIPSGTTERLVSGTRFIMSTDDPVEKPLPDPGLLTLQWHLQRVLAMSGAAGWKEEFSGDDEDNTSGQAVAADTEYQSESQSADHHQSQNSPGEDGGDSGDESPPHKRAKRRDAYPLTPPSDEEPCRLDRASKVATVSLQSGPAASKLSTFRVNGEGDGGTSVACARGLDMEELLLV